MGGIELLKVYGYTERRRMKDINVGANIYFPKSTQFHYFSLDHETTTTAVSERTRVVKQSKARHQPTPNPDRHQQRAIVCFILGCSQHIVVVHCSSDHFSFTISTTVAIAAAYPFYHYPCRVVVHSLLVLSVLTACPRMDWKFNFASSDFRE